MFCGWPSYCWDQIKAGRECWEMLCCDDVPCLHWRQQYKPCSHKPGILTAAVWLCGYRGRWRAPAALCQWMPGCDEAATASLKPHTEGSWSEAWISLRGWSTASPPSRSLPLKDQTERWNYSGLQIQRSQFSLWRLQQEVWPKNSPGAEAAVAGGWGCTGLQAAGTLL